MRLDAYLAKRYPEFSRSVWQKYIQAGYVSINGKKAAKTAMVSDESDICIDIPQSSQKPLDLPIIYEDDNVIVIDKPAGVLTHSKGALNDEFTVSDFIRTRSKGQVTRDKEPPIGSDPIVVKNTSIGSDPIELDNRFGIVHRLDRGTSGVMIGAKNEEVLKYLQRQFADRKVKKTYLAVVEKTPDVLRHCEAKPKQSSANEKKSGLLRHSVPRNDNFVIDLPMGRNPRQPATFRVDPKGKPAVTNVKVLENYDDGTALVELKPQTGRTHQLRVHMAHIGAPIVGDSTYGPSEKRRVKSEKSNETAPVDSKASNGARMMLHAAELEVTLPGGERRVFTSPPPSGLLRHSAPRNDKGKKA